MKKKTWWQTFINRRNGNFALTRTRARRWWHRPEPFPEDMAAVAAVLEAAGVKVHAVYEKWLDCDFLPDRIYEALSLKRSNPERARYYYEAGRTMGGAWELLK